MQAFSITEMSKNIYLFINCRIFMGLKNLFEYVYFSGVPARKSTGKLLLPFQKEDRQNWQNLWN